MGTTFSLNLIFHIGLILDFTRGRLFSPCSPHDAASLRERAVMFYLLCCFLLLFVHGRFALEADVSNTGDASATQTTVSVGKMRSNADEAFSKGDVELALKLMAKVIELEPKNENNFYKRFRYYLRQQKYKEALADLTSASTIKPDFEAVLVQRAKLLLRMGRCDDAEQDYIKVRNVNPNNRDLNGGIGEAAACSKAIRDGELAYARKTTRCARKLIHKPSGTQKILLHCI